MMEKTQVSTLLHGERVYLKKHEESLASQMYEYINSDRERLGKFLPWVPLIQNQNDEISYIKMTHQKWEQGTLFDYGIFRIEDGVYMGNIGLHTIDWTHHRAEIGYWILGHFEGKGYMSDAVKLLESHLFDVGFHRLEIHCSDLNNRSEKVPIRCGYTYEGTARENLRDRNKYRNTKIFAKLSTD